MKMDYKVSKEFITDEFKEIAEEMQKLYNKIQWTTEQCYTASILPDYGAIQEYFDDGDIKDKKENKEILVKLQSLDENLYAEGTKISKSIIKAKQKIQIFLDQNAELEIEEDLKEIEEEKNLKLDNLTLEEKIKLYFKYFGHISLGHVKNPYLILKEDMEHDQDDAYAFLDRKYYKVSINNK